MERRGKTTTKKIIVSVDSDVTKNVKSNVLVCKTRQE